MQKKIIALLLVVATLMTLCVGCKKANTDSQLNLEDVKADPGKYIEEGMKKSFEKSPFGDLVALKDPEAMSIIASMKPSNLDEYIKVDTTIAMKELAILAKLDAVVDGVEFNGSIFIDNENIAVESELLAEIFDNTAVGVGLKDFLKNFKDSAWYKYLIIDSGLDEALKNDNGEDIDIQAIFNLYSELAKDMNKIATESVKYEVTESQIEYDNTKIDVYQITQVASDDIDTTLVNRIKKFVDDVKVLLPSEIADELEIDEEYMKEELEQFKNTGKTTYVIGKNDGVVHKISYENTIKEESIWADETEIYTTNINFEMNFGADPAKEFVPSFTLAVDEDGEKVTITGKSSIDKSEKTFKIDADVKFTYPEDYEWSKEDDGTMTFTLDNDGNYKLIVESGDGEDKYHEEFAGKFKVDGTKVEFTVTVGEDDELVNIELAIDFNAKIPTAFKYDDIMKWDEEKIKDFIEKMEGTNQEPEWDDDAVLDVY